VIAAEILPSSPDWGSDLYPVRDSTSGLACSSIAWNLVGAQLIAQTAIRRVDGGMGDDTASERLVGVEAPLHIAAAQSLGYFFPTAPAVKRPVPSHPFPPARLGNGGEILAVPECGGEADLRRAGRECHALLSWSRICTFKAHRAGMRAMPSAHTICCSVMTQQPAARDRRWLEHPAAAL
jgi:hypothetical protein